MYIVGIDEAGRGPWAGPLFVALTVINYENLYRFIELGVDDSKKLSAKKRDKLFEFIVSNVDYYSVLSADVDLIDKLGVYKTTKKLIQDLVFELPIKYMFDSKIKIDGVFDSLDLKSRCINSHIDFECIIDGDMKEVCISAASIVAKVLRDREMIRLASLYPQYGFDKHKGYGTKSHIEALKKYGVSPVHRKSFKPIQKFLAFF
ncbi:MAG: ribonuclease HII [Candidatus Dojkabacteria bacterium]|nr:ribonuclease HII [Candidatus Dojkabacteria bacterium]